MARKRSMMVAAFLASAALAPILSSCAKRDDGPKVYSSVADCTSDGHTTSECSAAFNAAKSSTDTPHFTDKARCEAEFGTGNCETRASTSGGSGGWFVPAMAGYMLGSMNNGGGGSTTINHYNTAPVYRTTSGSYYSGSRPASFRSSSFSSSSYSGSSSRSSAFAGSSRSGGFGASAASHGGCCS